MIPSLACAAHPSSCMCDYQQMHILHTYILDDTACLCQCVQVCVVCMHSVSLSLSHSLSNTNTAEEVQDTSLSCIEIGIHMIQLPPPLLTLICWYVGNVQHVVDTRNKDSQEHRVVAGVVAA